MRAVWPEVAGLLAFVAVVASLGYAADRWLRRHIADREF